MNLSKLLKGCLASVALMMPMISHADMTLINYTDSPSVSYLNLGVCSTHMKKFGTTYPYSDTNRDPLTVPHNKLAFACGGKSTCTAIVIMGTNCDGVEDWRDYKHVGEANTVASVEISLGASQTDPDFITAVADHFSHYRIYGAGGVGTSPINSSFAAICDLNKKYPKGHFCIS